MVVVKSVCVGGVSTQLRNELFERVLSVPAQVVVDHHVVRFGLGSTVLFERVLKGLPVGVSCLAEFPPPVRVRLN